MLVKLFQHQQNSSKMRSLTLLRKINWPAGFRNVSRVAVKPEDQETKKSVNRMSGWQIHSYSDNIEDLQLSDNLKKPFIRRPTELLVKVHASSVNPIDVAMMSKLLKVFYLIFSSYDDVIQFQMDMARRFLICFEVSRVTLNSR